MIAVPVGAGSVDFDVDVDSTSFTELPLLLGELGLQSRSPFLSEV